MNIKIKISYDLKSLQMNYVEKSWINIGYIEEGNVVHFVANKLV